MKWLSEKHIEHRMENCTVTRAGDRLGGGLPRQPQRPDARFRAVLANSLPNDADILHEYFIPRSQFVSFVDGMRKVLTDNRTNLLNASVRVVHQENNFLTYSPEPAFSLVLYINQTTDDEGNLRMKKATEELIDLTIAHKGRFFLPISSIIRRISCSARIRRSIISSRRSGSTIRASCSRINFTRSTRHSLIASLRGESDEAIRILPSPAMDCFAEPVIRRRFAPTGWLAMTKRAACRCSRRLVRHPAPATRPRHRGGRRNRNRRSVRS